LTSFIKSDKIIPYKKSKKRSKEMELLHTQAYDANSVYATEDERDFPIERWTPSELPCDTDAFGVMEARFYGYNDYTIDDED
jgi:hypothetical protein